MTAEENVKRARVYLTGVASTVIDVELDMSTLAEGEDWREAAVDLAHEQNRASLCYQCAQHMDAPGEWVADSWTPRNQSLTENVIEL